MSIKTGLLAVTGLTPQVITETLYALHQPGQAMPEQIHILTTAEGYQRARLTLINDGWLLKRQLAEQPSSKCPSEGAPELDYAQQYLQEYRLITGELGGTDRTLNTLEPGMSKIFFEQRKSRINKLLQQTLAQAASAYLISPVGKCPNTRYQILLATDQSQSFERT